MPDAREQQGYHLGFAHLEISGNLVRDIIQLLYCRLHFSACRGFYGARIVNDAGNGSHGYAG